MLSEVTANFEKVLYAAGNCFIEKSQMLFPKNFEEVLFLRRLLYLIYMIFASVFSSTGNRKMVCQIIPTVIFGRTRAKHHFFVDSSLKIKLNTIISAWP